MGRFGIHTSTCQIMVASSNVGKDLVDDIKSTNVERSQESSGAAVELEE